jgi:hypothetical protein
MGATENLKTNGRWITFKGESEGQFINHFFMDGFATKKSIALCGHNAKGTYKINLWGHVLDCPMCTSKLNEIRKMEV